MPTIKVPPVLREQTEGQAEVAVEGATVGEALRALAERYPSTKGQLFSDEGHLNRYVNVYLNEEDVSVLGGLDTEASDSDTVAELVERYSPERRFRLDVKPSLTGQMHIHGRGELTFEERLAVELDHVENLSVGRDLRTLALTPVSVVRGTGAF